MPSPRAKYYEAAGQPGTRIPESDLSRCTFCSGLGQNVYRGTNCSTCDGLGKVYLHPDGGLPIAVGLIEPATGPGAEPDGDTRRRALRQVPSSAVSVS